MGSLWAVLSEEQPVKVSKATVMTRAAVLAKGFNLDQPHSFFRADSYPTGRGIQPGIDVVTNSDVHFRANRSGASRQVLCSATGAKR